MTDHLSARKVRQRVATQDRMLTAEVVPALQQLMHNDRVSQAKIDALDKQLTTSLVYAIQWDEIQCQGCRNLRRQVGAWTFWQRLNWIVRGVYVVNPFKREDTKEP